MRMFIRAENLPMKEGFVRNVRTNPLKAAMLEAATVAAEKDLVMGEEESTEASDDSLHDIADEENVPARGWNGGSYVTGQRYFD